MFTRPPESDDNSVFANPNQRNALNAFITKPKAPAPNSGVVGYRAGFGLTKPKPITTDPFKSGRLVTEYPLVGAGQSNFVNRYNSSGYQSTSISGGQRPWNSAIDRAEIAKKGGRGEGYISDGESIILLTGAAVLGKVAASALGVSAAKVTIPLYLAGTGALSARDYMQDFSLSQQRYPMIKLNADLSSGDVRSNEQIEEDEAKSALDFVGKGNPVYAGLNKLEEFLEAKVVGDLPRKATFIGRENFKNYFDYISWNFTQLVSQGQEDSNKDFESPNQTVASSFVNFGKDLARDARNIPLLYGSIPGKLAETNRAIEASLERNPPTSLAQNIARRISGGIGGVADSDDRNAMVTTGYFGNIVAPLASPGIPISRVLGAISNISGYSSLQGIYPSSLAITYRKMLLDSGVPEDKRLQAMQLFDETGIWDKKLVPLPDLSDSVSAWINYGLHHGEDKFNELPLVTQIIAALYSPAIVNSGLKNLGRLATKLESSTLEALGVGNKGLLSTMADTLTPQYWSLSGDYAYDKSVFATQSEFIKHASDVVAINSSKGLTPTATAENVVQILFGKDFLSSPSPIVTIRNAIAASARSIATTSFIAPIFERTINSKVNQIQKVMVDSLVEVLQVNGASNAPVIFNLLADSVKSSTALEKLNEMLPMVPIDEVVKKGLKMGFEQTTWADSTVGMVTRQVANQIREVATDKTFLKNVEKIFVARNTANVIEQSSLKGIVDLQAVQDLGEEAFGEVLRHLTKSLHSISNTEPVLSGAWRKLQQKYGVLQVLMNPGAWFRNFQMGVLEAMTWEEVTGAKRSQTIRRMLGVEGSSAIAASARGKSVDTTYATKGGKKAGPMRQLLGRELEVEIGKDGFFDYIKENAANMYQGSEEAVASHYINGTLYKFITRALDIPGFLLRGAESTLALLPEATQKAISDHRGLFTPEAVKQHFRRFVSQVSGTQNLTQLTDDLYTLYQRASDSRSPLDPAIVREFIDLLAKQPPTGNADDFSRVAMDYLSGEATNYVKHGELMVRAYDTIRRQDLLDLGWSDLFGEKGSMTNKILFAGGRRVNFESYLDEAAYFISAPIYTRGDKNAALIAQIKEVVQRSGMNLDEFVKKGESLFSKIDAVVIRDLADPTLRINKNRYKSVDVNVPTFINASDPSNYDNAATLRMLDNQKLNYARSRYHALAALGQNLEGKSINSVFYNKDTDTFDFTRVTWDKEANQSLADFLSSTISGEIFGLEKMSDGKYNWRAIPRSWVISDESGMVDLLDRVGAATRTEIGAQISVAESAIKQGAKTITGKFAEVYNTAVLQNDGSIEAGIRAVYQKYIPEVSNVYSRGYQSLRQLLGNPVSFPIEGEQYTVDVINQALTVPLNPPQLINISDPQKAAMRTIDTIDTLYEWALRIPAEFNILRPLNPQSSDSVILKLEEHALGVLNQTRAQAKQVATRVRDVALFDYSDKFGIDEIAGGLFGYPYWYLRTYSNFPRLVLENPFHYSMIERLRRKVFTGNEDRDVANYEKNSLYIDVPFGLEEYLGSKTIAVPLMRALDPLLNLVQGKFKNYERETSGLGFLYNEVFGWGPGPHTGIQMLMGAALSAAAWHTGEYKYNLEAQEYFNRTSSLHSVFNSLTGVLQKNGLLPGTGGLEADTLTHVINSVSLLKEMPTVLQGPKNLISTAISFLPTAYGYLNWNTVNIEQDGGGTIYRGTTRDHKRATAVLVEYNKAARESGGQFNLEGYGNVTTELVAEAANYANIPHVFDVTRPELAQAAKLFKFAANEAVSRRAISDIFTFLGGPATNVQTESVIAQQAQYKQADAVAKECETASPEKCKELYQEMASKFPAMSITNIRSVDPREGMIHYAYASLARVGPGNRDAIYQAVGLNRDLISEFYKGKGQVWSSGAKQEQFFNGITRLGAVLRQPDEATVEQWNTAQALYKRMNSKLNAEYVGSQSLKDFYYNLKNDNDKELFLEKHPVLKARFLEETRLLIDTPEYKQSLAPYYVSQGEVERVLFQNWLGHERRGRTKEEREEKSVRYQYYLMNRDTIKGEDRDLYFRLYDLRQYHVEYEAFQDNKSNIVKDLLYGVKLAEFPDVRTDLSPESQDGKNVIEVLSKYYTKALEQFNLVNQRQAEKSGVAGPSGSLVDPVMIPGAVKVMPRLSVNPPPPQTSGIDWSKALRESAEYRSRIPYEGPVITIEKAGQEWETLRDKQSQTTVMGYIGKNAEAFIAQTLGPVANEGLTETQLNEVIKTPYSARWPTLKNAVDLQSTTEILLAWVGQYPDARGIAHAMMLEASTAKPGSSLQDRQVWQRVAGTLAGMSDKDLQEISQKYPLLLGDAQRIKDATNDHLSPSMLAHFDVLGFDVSRGTDGNFSLSAKTVKFPIPEDRFEASDVREFIEDRSLEMFGPDIFQKVDHYIYLATIVGSREAKQYYRANPEIGKYQVFSDKVWERYEEAKNPKDNKKKGSGPAKRRAPYNAMDHFEDQMREINRMKKMLEVDSPKAKQYDTIRSSSSGRRSNRSYSSVGTRGYPIMPYRSKKQTGEGYRILLSKLQVVNPNLANSFRDFMESSPSRRTVILQANPDLSRYLSTLDQEVFLQLENSFRAGVIATQSESKNQNTALKVYPPISDRTGL